MSVPDWMIDTPSPSVDDMAALIRRLARSLRKAAPGHALADQALDYLMRVGMKGDIMRAPAEAPANEIEDVVIDVMHDIRSYGYATKDGDMDKAASWMRQIDGKLTALAAPAQGDALELADADPLQGAANWLAEAHGQFSPVILSGCLMIGHNRATRLHDKALALRAARQSKGDAAA